jgi:aspartyl protease family protein
VRGFWLLLFMIFPLGAASAAEIQATMLAEGRALLEIDGKSRMLREGDESPEGVKLISATPQVAMIDYQGQRQSLALNRRISTRFTEADKPEVRIASNQGGHYVTPGRINGKPVQFMVDTGATTVAMNEATAIRLGIDYRASAPISVGTAAGRAQAFGVRLDRVSVGNLEVTQVDAVVIVGDSPPFILLGNTFLTQVDMRIEAGVLLLKAKH